MYCDGVDGVRRFEPGTDFVLKENTSMKTLLRVFKNPRYFYPDRYFSCKAHNKQYKLGWLKDYANGVFEKPMLFCCRLKTLKRNGL